MRTSFVLLAACATLIACVSSSSGGNGSSVSPACKGGYDHLVAECNNLEATDWAEWCEDKGFASGDSACITERQQLSACYATGPTSCGSELLPGERIDCWTLWDEYHACVNLGPSGGTGGGFGGSPSGGTGGGGGFTGGTGGSFGGTGGTTTGGTGGGGGGQTCPTDFQGQPCTALQTSDPVQTACLQGDCCDETSACLADAQCSSFVACGSACLQAGGTPQSCGVDCSPCMPDPTLYTTFQTCVTTCAGG